MYSCFSPIKIYNKALGEEIYTDCGKCDFCRNKRAFELQSRIDREFLDTKNKSAFFLTLTYDNDNLPVYEYNLVDDVWQSNRKDVEFDRVFGIDRYPDLESSDVDRYVKPIKYDKSNNSDYYDWFRSESNGSKYDNDSFLEFLEIKKLTDKYPYMSSARVLERVDSNLLKRKKYNKYVDEKLSVLSDFDKSDVKAFGHLCYIDLFRFISLFRQFIHRDFRRKRRFVDDLEFENLKEKYKSNPAKYVDDLERLQRVNYLNTYFKEWTYEDIQVRYFACGEYGPVTLRPHYHIILWFKRELNANQLRYIQKVISACWSYGSYDLQAVTNGGVASYISSYVVSSDNLPRILQKKHLRPFVIFSKNPVIGSYEISDDEIQEILYNGVVTHRKYNKSTKEFEDVNPPVSFLRRYFPRCNAFGYGDDTLKLQVYSAVFRYFENLGIKHTPESVKLLRLCDIDWDSISLFDSDNNKYVVGADGLLHLEWRYLDKYASLVCYKYCIMFGMSPVQVFDAINRVYSKLNIKSLSDYYSNMEDLYNSGDETSIMFNINKDPDFLVGLPESVHDLSLTQIYALENYCIDIDFLYIDEVLCFTNLDSLRVHNDPRYKDHCSSHSQTRAKKVKTKKLNSYKSKLQEQLTL